MHETIMEVGFKIQDYHEKTANCCFRVLREEGEFMAPAVDENCLQITGYSFEDYESDPSLWLDIIPWEERQAVINAFEKAISGEGSSLIEHRIIEKNGSVSHVTSRITSIPGNSDNVNSCYMLVRNESRRRIAEESIIFDSLYDTVTKLPKRYLLMERLERSLARRRRREEHRTALLLVSLEGFDELKSDLWKEAGNSFINEAAEKLKTSLRSGDTVARLQESEFALLLEDIENRDNALRVAKRIQQVLMFPFELEGEEVYVKPFIGIVINGGEQSSAEKMMINARIAMYRSRDKGAGESELFNNQIEEPKGTHNRLNKIERRAFSYGT